MIKAVLSLAAIMPLAIAGVGRAKDEIAMVTAEELSKVYATDPAAFDKTYKGQTVTVEGVVSTAATRSSPVDKTRYCVLVGYKKPGERFGYQVNCAVGPGFEGIRIGHKVQIRGTSEGHSPTRTAVQLTDCTVVKVLSEDFPPSKEAAAVVKALQGKWTVTSIEGAGARTANQLGLDVMEVEGNEMTWRAFTGKKEGAVSRDIPFGLSVDPGKTPKEMTLYLGAGTLPALYELDGDKLRICMPLLTKSLKDAKRPVAMAGGQNGEVVVTAERAK
ncbi:TIGR03067 domain-containing protein [Zavarzinella formosa]|uniref:TIGR03067 domain-containing protein n=1 Tax=Zavarzinella formosa TaxID=360055 RepID=UPI0002E42429|nr:TIGR03067 domain-containing protein [Zavarzinella formosa]